MKSFLEFQQIDEVNHREHAQAGKVHPTMAKHMTVGQEHDFYHPKTGDKISGVVKHKSDKEVHLQANKDGKVGGGDTHKFSIAEETAPWETDAEAKKRKQSAFKKPNNPNRTGMDSARALAMRGLAAAKKKQNEEVEIEENAPVAPVPDRKYIKGTPENKALKASRKPINGHPTNKMKEEVELDEAKKCADCGYVHTGKCEMDEALVGGQKNLDKDKNGKLTKKDFELLRKEDQDFDDATLDAMIFEVLSKDAKAGDWIHDFVHSDNPKFAGKSKEKRKQMALAAYYAKQRNEEVELEEAVTVKTEKHSWGTMKTVHHGASFSIPLHPEHHQEIAKLKDEQEHHFKTEDGKHWTARRKGDDVHFQGANGGNSTKVPHHTMKEQRLTYKDLMEIKLADLPVRKVTGRSYGAQYHDPEGDDDADEHKPSKPSTEKRGRGRPSGSKSGARQQSSSKKSYGGLAVHSLNLPNSNK